MLPPPTHTLFLSFITLYIQGCFSVFHISTALTSLTYVSVPIKCHLNSSKPFCISLRPSNSGACLHGETSGIGEACGDDLQGAASPPLPGAALRVASVKQVAPCRSLRRPKRRDRVHHPQSESRRLGGVHL